MKTHWISKKFEYDGTQLRPLFAYFTEGVLGNSVVSWVGSCNVSFEHMVDGEDLLAKSEIRGAEMLHFIFEIFDRDLTAGVFLQRLFASICKDLIEERSKVRLFRKGDDLYWDQKKLSISIATKSSNSVLVHFAMNVKNQGIPVPACALHELGVEPKEFAEQAMCRVAEEYQSILDATHKVKTV
jgi:hypothetical protein